MSETLDILTKNPEIWKKTIFILTYDENDGYFDHIPPFVPPHTGREEEGAVATGVDTEDEYVTAAQEKIRTGNPDATLDSPIGLGFRVPLVVASPWTKGGWVNSEVFDHTSTLQFLEHFLEKKTGKKIYETNIGTWRRLVCGDLTSVFRPAGDRTQPTMDPLSRDGYVARIYSAKNKDLPGNYAPLRQDELQQLKKVDHRSVSLPRQEPGTKPACAIPYDIAVNAEVNSAAEQLSLSFTLGGTLPKTKTLGVPFRVQSLIPHLPENEVGRTWNFAAREGEDLSYRWPLAQFAGNRYHMHVHGPNGFFREFVGGKHDPELQIAVFGDPKDGNLRLRASSSQQLQLTLTDKSYGQSEHSLVINGQEETLVFDLSDSHGWYDLLVEVTGHPGYQQRFAGHVETGKPSITDPLMAG